jgi:hypothetical protein
MSGVTAAVVATTTTTWPLTDPNPCLNEEELAAIATGLRAIFRDVRVTAVVEDSEFPESVLAMILISML